MTNPYDEWSKLDRENFRQEHDSLDEFEHGEFELGEFDQECQSRCWDEEPKPEHECPKCHSVSVQLVSEVIEPGEIRNLLLCCDGCRFRWYKPR
jgi:hypothetical protein